MSFKPKVLLVIYTLVHFASFAMALPQFGYKVNYKWQACSLTSPNCPDGYYCVNRILRNVTDETQAYQDLLKVDKQLGKEYYQKMVPRCIKGSEARNLFVDLNMVRDAATGVNASYIYYPVLT